MSGVMDDNEKFTIRTSSKILPLKKLFEIMTVLSEKQWIEGYMKRNMAEICYISNISCLRTNKPIIVSKQNIA